MRAKIITMPTNTESLAVETKDLVFYYLTPRKTKPSKYLPFRRIEFEKSTALNHVSFSLRKGEITALLGKNGSGKTTLIKCITGARMPHSGTVKVFGGAPEKSRYKVGLCLGASLIYHRLSGRENLEYFGRLYSVPNVDQRIEELGELLSLHHQLDALVETYSFGMKAKLALARAMIHSPELLILDEPTLGIDFQLALQIREFVKSLNCTVLLTTHYMEEAEMLANNLAIIDKGHLLTSGTKAQVLAREGVTTVGDAFVKLVEDDQKLRSVS
jgi:ABC-type multidrug transport system ATPase subunit